MPSNMKRYDLEAVNVNKNTKKKAKDFCIKHGLVFSKFVELALLDRMVKVQKVFEHLDSDIIEHLDSDII